MRFNVNKQIVREKFLAKPEGKEGITFLLNPISSDNIIDYIAYETAPDTKAMLKYKISMATQRIAGWEGITDEENNLLPFNIQNLWKLLEHKEFLAYMFIVAEHTILAIQAEEREEADKLEKGKSAKAQAVSSKAS